MKMTVDICNMYVCMYVCMYVSMYVHMHTYACMYVNILYKYVFWCIEMCLYNTCMNADVWVC